MLLARIQRDLFDFTDQDPEDFDGLVEFWYERNSPALSAALTAQPGINLIVNVGSFQSFETLAKRLFLISDTLVLRDARDWAKDEPGYRDVPMPTGPYKPRYLDEVIDHLGPLCPSPMTLLQRPEYHWTSTNKTLNNGLHIAYAGCEAHNIPSEFLRWIQGAGRDYLKTGQIVYAPFIPTLGMELEFLKNGVNLPAHFNAASCFHQRHDWLTEDRLAAILALQVPFLDGLDITTIARVKEDNREEFGAFSRTLLDAINGVKSAVGTEGFVREVRNIQRNQVDAALSDVSKTVGRIKQSRALRSAGILTGLLGLNGAAYLLGIPETTIATGLTSSAVALVGEKVARLRERGELQDKKGYFLWRLRDCATN